MFSHKMHRALGLFLWALTALPNGLAILCPDGWFEGAERCFRAFAFDEKLDKRGTWIEGMDLCAKVGTTLATVHKPIDGYIVRSLISHHSNDCWIGLRKYKRYKPERGWLWVDRSQALNDTHYLDWGQEWQSLWKVLPPDEKCVADSGHGWTARPCWGPGSQTSCYVCATLDPDASDFAKEALRNRFRDSNWWMPTADEDNAAALDSWNIHAQNLGESVEIESAGEELDGSWNGDLKADAAVDPQLLKQAVPSHGGFLDFSYTGPEASYPSSTTTVAVSTPLPLFLNPLSDGDGSTSSTTISTTRSSPSPSLPSAAFYSSTIEAPLNAETDIDNDNESTTLLSSNSPPQIFSPAPDLIFTSTSTVPVSTHTTLESTGSLLAVTPNSDVHNTPLSEEGASSHTSVTTDSPSSNDASTTAADGHETTSQSQNNTVTAQASSSVVAMAATLGILGALSVAVAGVITYRKLRHEDVTFPSPTNAALNDAEEGAESVIYGTAATR